MCIRDSAEAERNQRLSENVPADHPREFETQFAEPRTLNGICLLYTSDAADERSSVDLGGRRIIKKKKKTTQTLQQPESTQCTPIYLVPHSISQRH